MTASNDKELFTCFECAITGREALVELDTNGRCSVCKSDAVLTAHQVASLSVPNTGRVHTVEQERRGPVEKSVGGFLRRVVGSTPKHEARIYYHFTHGAWETIVSSQDAKDEVEATSIAYNNVLQPWYRHGLAGLDIPMKPVKLSHSEYCDWLQKH